MLSTLKAKFVVSFVVLQVIVLVLIISINFYSLKKASNDLISEKNLISSHMLTELIKMPMVTYDLSTIDEAIQHFSTLQNVIAIMIKDSQGMEIASYIKDSTISPMNFEKLISGESLEDEARDKYVLYTSSISIESQKLGEAYFIYGINNTLNTIRDNENITYILAFLSIFIGFFASYFVGGKLGKSLEHLTRIAKNVSNDVYVDIPHSFRGNYEIDKLFVAMYKMQAHITQRTNKLNDSNNNLQQYVNALDDSAIVSKTDLDGKITSVNSRFCEVTGFSENELIGNTHSLLRDPKISNDFYKILWETIRAKKTFNGTFRNIKKNGKPFYVDATISPMLDNDGNIKEYIAIRFEVTELVDAKNRAIEAKKIKEQFLSNMSHEIRTPLNAIIGFLQPLRMNIRDAQSLKYISIIESSSESLLHIINDILDISKIESNKLIIDKHKFHPILEFQKAVEIFTTQANKKSIELLLNIDSNIPQCFYGDLLRIKQILYNLLSNALKFTDDNKMVSVSIDYDYDSSTLSICVKDEGIGLSLKDQDKIFTPFEQADNSTTRKFGGTGLGLAISINLAKLMDGRISIDSVEGVGSTFKLKIPIEICQEPLEIRENVIIKDAQLSGSILVAEDNKTNQLLIKIILKKYNLTPTIANDGVEAVKIFKSEKFDLVLMDESMPNMTGLEAFRKIREYEDENSLPYTPVVAITANVMQEDKQRFLSAGMNDFLAKPIDNNEFERVLYQYLLNNA